MSQPLSQTKPARAPAAADTTKIEWTAITDAQGVAVPGYTFNPWEGCAKVSAGCANCYAEGQHNLYYSALKSEGQPGTCWGVNAPRLARTEVYWKAPLRWNKLAAEAQAAGREVNRRRVFCASMADVFEDQPEASRAHAGTSGRVPTGKGTDREVRFVDIDHVRVRLLRLIYDTPHLDWLLLTKRPENIVPALKRAMLHIAPCPYPFLQWVVNWIEGTPPVNVWLGTSVEHQMAAEERIPRLLEAPAVQYFLSCEPLLGPLDLPLKYCVGCHGFTRTIEVNNGKDWGCAGCKTYKGSYRGRAFQPSSVRGIGWVIVGGESGPRARLQNPEWVRGIQAQCKEAGVPFLFKQMGLLWGKAEGASDKHGGKLEEIPAEFRVRESPPSIRGSGEGIDPPKRTK
jgi:protein gp37